MEAFIEQAGGLMLFNQIAREILEPTMLEKARSQYFPSSAARIAYIAQRNVMEEFVYAEPSDTSNYVVCLRTHGYLVAEGVWWKRQTAAPGWIVCEFPTILQDRLRSLARLHRIFARVNRVQEGSLLLRLDQMEHTP